MAETENKKTAAPDPAADKADETVYRRLLSEDEEKIYSFIRAKIKAADEREGTGNHTKALVGFEKSLNRTRGDNLRPKTKGKKRLCYEHIPELINIAGISYLELINGISTDPDGNPFEARWATRQEAEMCALCDMLSEDKRDQVLNLVRELASDEVRKLNLENADQENTDGIIQRSRVITADEMQPVDKVTVANILRAFDESEIATRMKGMGDANAYTWRFRLFRFNLIRFSRLAHAAVESDISLHWLLGLDESTPLLAKYGRTETVMAYFCLLPVSRKNIVMEAMTHTGGKDGESA